MSWHYWPSLRFLSYNTAPGIPKNELKVNIPSFPRGSALQAHHSIMYQSFVTMTSTSEELRNIDGEIERLKLQLVHGDTQGHSCQYCSNVKITFRGSVTEQSDGSSYYSLETTDEWVCKSAALGCNFWSMISDRLSFVREREKAKYVFDGARSFPHSTEDFSSSSRGFHLTGANQSERRRNPLRAWAKELGVCWNDVNVAPACSHQDVHPSSLPRSRSPEDTARIPKDLLRLTFRTNAVRSYLEVTLELLETSDNRGQLAPEYLSLPIWSSSKSQAELWALVPPSK